MGAFLLFQIAMSNYRLHKDMRFLNFYLTPTFVSGFAGFSVCVIVFRFAAFGAGI